MGWLNEHDTCLTKPAVFMLDEGNWIDKKQPWFSSTTVSEI
jgi:hypothetical protein